MQCHRPVGVPALPCAVHCSLRSRYYKCDNPLCIATAPCSDPGWNNSAYENCGCALQTTAAMPDPDECGPSSYTQCTATGQLFCNPKSDATGVATLCTETIEPGSCSSDAGLGNNACPMVGRWAEFYEGIGTNASHDSLCDVPCNNTVSNITDGIVDCDYVPCCRWTEFEDGIHCGLPSSVGGCAHLDADARLCPSTRLDKTVCDHITVPSIFGDDACLCNTGHRLVNGSKCELVEFDDTVCGIEEYASFPAANSSYECIPATNCSGDTLVDLTGSSDRVCALPPTVCVGILGGDGICVTPEATCTSIQFVRGSLPTGKPDCATLSLPCTGHSYEVTPPTPTSDRVCRRYTVFHTFSAVSLAMVPSALYAAIALGGSKLRRKA